ncbi:MAG: fumarylacetoacetate (FAA) hydrolase family protein [Pontimonas sp.]|jgi:fumarylacetoacetate (FAA) hydrolase family protein
MDENSGTNILPIDADEAILVARVWDPVSRGPRVCRVEGQSFIDITRDCRTVSELCEVPDQALTLGLGGPTRWSLDEVLSGSKKGGIDQVHFLAPIDLQVVKACGVTFVGSLIERVIEERCAGDSSKAEGVRAELITVLGGSLKALKPGSASAEKVKEVLLAQGLWSQYLEVGIGPDPEVFTKAPVLSSVGWGAEVGIPGFSHWNNPEPELVLVVNSGGTPVGAMLGNDVNLRDVEGRSALLLGKAKDNNAQSALGPFLRIFDSSFTLDTVSEEEIRLSVTGRDGFEMTGTNSLAEISRPLEELVGATWGVHHQYPDGFALYTGTLFSPTKDRGVPGSGFTHKPGDRVVISSSHLGALANTTATTESLEPWVFGIRELMDYFARSV